MADLLVWGPAEYEAADKDAAHVAALDGGEEGQTFTDQLPLKTKRPIIEIILYT
jgi:hypothetical protein